MALLVALVAASAAVAEPWSCDGFVLEEVSEALGFEFVHDRGARGERHLPETMGAGLSWIDYDGDGWLDLFLVQSGAFPPEHSEGAGDRLYRNLEGRGFVDASARAGVSSRGYGQGAAAADLEGDGDTDLLVTNFGFDVVLENLGDGRFSERRLEPGAEDAAWSSSAALADADGDGDLDLYVTRYVEYDPESPIWCGDSERRVRRYCDPGLFAGAPDVYYENRDGEFVRREDLLAERSRAGRGLGVVFVDLDGDRRPDLYVANDQTLNRLLRNAGDGFDDVSLASGTAANADGLPEAGMGIAVGDVDGDLLPDLLVTNFDGETNTLYRNLGDMAFEDASVASGLGLPSFDSLAFGVALADLDLDGSLDAYFANGHVFERPHRRSSTYRQDDQVFRGDGRGRFAELDCPGLGRGATVARGAAAADLDNDGDPDLAVQENGGPLALLRNGARGGWLGVRLAAAPPNTGGIGARVTLARRQDLGPESSGSQVRWVLAGDSYQSSSDPRALFGLGGAEVGELEVRWPSGRRQRLVAPPADRYLVVAEPGAASR